MLFRSISTFSGISAASVAWNDFGNGAGIDIIAYAEPEAAPAHILAVRRGASRPKYLPEGPKFAAKKYADMSAEGIPNFGDITQITDEDLEALGPVDILEGGSPCQGFSLAGLRKGLNDDRSNLALAFCGLAIRMQRINGLKFVLWENVKGCLSDATNGFGNLLSALVGEECALVAPRNKWSNAGHVIGPEGRVAWRTLDAKFWGVAQHRERVFALASFGAGCIDPGTILFEPAVESRNSSTEPKDQVSVSRSSRGIGTAFALAMDAKPNDSKGLAFTLKAANKTNPQAVAYFLSDDYHPKSSPDTAFTLLAGSPTGGGHKQMVVHANGNGRWIVRRLTPLECERLQGFPDGWTDIEIRGKRVADGPRYRALGNSMAIPCMRFIGLRLLEAVAEQTMNMETIKEAA